MTWWILTLVVLGVAWAFLEVGYAVGQRIGRLRGIQEGAELATRQMEAW